MTTATTAIARSVVDSVDILNAKLICAATMSGHTAKVISNLKPNAPILALVPDDKTGRRLALNWGVYPANVGVMDSTDEIIKVAKEKAIEKSNLQKDDIIVITGSFPKHQTKHTNLMKIEQI